MRTPLPFGQAKLQVGIDIAGSPSGVASFSGSGTLAVPNPPSADRVFDVALTYDVLGNDTDADTSDTLTVTAVAGVGGNVGTGVAGSAGGTFTIESDGSYTFEPGTAFDDLAVGESRVTTVTYTISDGNGGTDTATLTITIQSANDGPVVSTAAIRVRPAIPRLLHLTP